MPATMGVKTATTAEERSLPPAPRFDGTISFRDDPEEWIRAVTLVFNAPDLVPVVLADTHPWPAFDEADPVIVLQLPDHVERIAAPAAASVDEAVAT
ncbi:MAG TPA: hypothetical protein VJ741_24070 [Solirubrobacteraceae bacterium]|nr:hypothetical protein [Solirubrobacteraceae bacterium]